MISKTLWNREIEPTPEKSFLFRYLAPLGKLADNGLVTERIQYSVPNCFPATLAAYRKSTNLQHVTGLFSIFFQILKWTILFHISRHSFAKMAKEKGLDNLEVKALLAHTNISTTQKYMGEFDTQRDDAALGKVFAKEDDAEKLLKQLQGVNPNLLKVVLERLAK